MNKVILMGRLTKDPDVRYTQGETPVANARFTLAVDRRFSRQGEERKADFINCVAWRQTAEFIERYGRKGTKFVVEGRIETGSYQNKEGQTVYTTDVVVENVEFAESKNAQGGGGDYTAPARQAAPAPAGNDFMNIPDAIEEELPFT